MASIPNVVVQINVTTNIELAVGAGLVPLAERQIPAKGQE